MLNCGLDSQRRLGFPTKGRLGLGVAGAGRRYWGAALGRHLMQEGAEAEIGTLVGERLK